MDVINSDIKKTEFIFEDYENRSNQLKDICKELRNKNKEEKFIFGLDALFYQISLFNVDYQHFRKLHSINLNRFYSKKLNEYVLKKPSFVIGSFVHFLNSLMELNYLMLNIYHQL